MSEFLAVVVLMVIVYLLWRTDSLKQDVKVLRAKQSLDSGYTVHVSKSGLEAVARYGSEFKTDPSLAETACGRNLIPAQDERIGCGVVFTSDTDDPDAKPTCPKCVRLLEEARRSYAAKTTGPSTNKTP